MFWRGFETDSEKLTIDRQYAIENNHGSNGYHGYSLVIRHSQNIRVIFATADPSDGGRGSLPTNDSTF